MNNKMIYAGIAVIIVVAAAFLMFRQKPKEIAEDTSLGSEFGKAQSEAIVEDLKKSDIEAVDPNVAVAGENMNDKSNLTKPELTIDQAKLYKAVLHTTEGDITIELNAADTPITANNFVYLAKSSFYDNTVFHRVIEGFMIQGGDPTGTGTGSPGYRFADEPFSGEYKRGTVAMANSGPNTNGSQFFIMHADYPLPKNYVIFGSVVEGIEVVDKIATAETTMSMGGEKSKPVSPVAVSSVDIIEE